LTEGLHFVNPFAQVVSMTVRTETYTMSAARDEGAIKGDDSIAALSSDGLMMPLDITSHIDSSPRMRHGCIAASARTMSTK